MFPRKECCYSYVTTPQLVSQGSKTVNREQTNLSISSFVSLVSEDEEWEVLRVLRIGFHKEILAPEVKVLKTLCIGNVIYQNACLGSSVERHTQTLVPFLTCCVPYLQISIIIYVISIPIASLFWVHLRQLFLIFYCESLLQQSACILERCFYECNYNRISLSFICKVIYFWIIDVLPTLNYSCYTR